LRGGGGKYSHPAATPGFRPESDDGGEEVTAARRASAGGLFFELFEHFFRELDAFSREILFEVFHAGSAGNEEIVG
jgi:hypothetical protein